MSHILIEGSNRGLVYLLKTLIKSHDIVVDTISDKQRVIERCASNKYQLIIFTDIAPYFTSMNIVEHLRSELGTVPAIFVLAPSRSEQLVLTLLECGVNQYITLPVSVYRLRNKIGVILGREEQQC